MELTRTEADQLTKAELVRKNTVLRSRLASLIIEMDDMKRMFDLEHRENIALIGDLQIEREIRGRLERLLSDARADLVLRDA